MATARDFFMVNFSSGGVATPDSETRKKECLAWDEMPRQVTCAYLEPGQFTVNAVTT